MFSIESVKDVICVCVCLTIDELNAIYMMEVS
jgi:hypothetical protein